MIKVVEGGDVKEAVTGEAAQGVKNLVGKLQSGGGRKRKSRLKTGIIIKPSDIIGKTVPQKALLKKKRIDTLGFIKNVIQKS